MFGKAQCRLMGRWYNYYTDARGIGGGAQMKRMTNRKAGMENDLNGDTGL